MGDLSPEMEQCLKDFKLHVEKTQSNDGRFDDYDFLRFCRARKFKLEDVIIMWDNTTKWRVERKVDEVA